MIYKTINQALVAFLEVSSESNQLDDSWLPISKLVYIQQLSKDRRIPTQYKDSIHFVKLAELSQKAKLDIQSKYPNFRPEICTSSMFVDNNGNEIVAAAQDMQKHVLENPADTFCVREMKKQLGLLRSGEGYDMCSGCNTNNHSEANTIQKAKDEGKYERLLGSTLYLYNHFWCCDSCREKLFEAGISNIIIDPNCDWIFGDKPVEWYHRNDL